MHDVPPVLFVAREAASEGERVDEGPPNELIERFPVAGLGGADQLRLVQQGSSRGNAALRPVRAGKGYACGAARTRMHRRGSLWAVWRLSQRQYFFISMRSRSFTRLL